MMGSATRSVLLSLALALLLGGLGAECVAQAPPSVERVRERVRMLRGGPGGPTVVREAQRPPQVESVLPVQRPVARTGERVTLTRQDLRAFEERLVRRIEAVIARRLAAERRMAYRGAVDSLGAFPAPPPPSVVQYYTQQPEEEPPLSELAPEPVAELDTTDEDPPLPSDSILGPSAQPPPDTVIQSRVVQVRRSLLETGLFRAFEVNFASGQSQLLPRARRSLEAVGEVLQQYPALRLEIAGYTDAVGGEASNQELSEARAEAVRNYLVEQYALSPDRFVARGYGEANPIANNRTAAGRELNRRVEFVVLNPEAAERILDTSTVPDPE